MIEKHNGRLMGFSTVQLIVWSVSTLLVMLHQLFQYGLSISMIIIDSYLDTFLLPIVLLPLIQLEHRLLLKDYEYSMPILLIIGLMISFIIISEYIFTTLDKVHFFYDVWDIVMIIIGTIIYYLIYNKYDRKLIQ